MRQRQLTNLGMILALVPGLLTYLANSGEPAGAMVRAKTALGVSGASQVVTSSSQLQTWFAGHRVVWYSGNGLVQVESDYDLAGKLVSIERLAQTLRNRKQVVESTVVYPIQRAWATGILTYNPRPFISPSLIRTWLKTMAKVLTGSPITIAGHKAVQLAPGPGSTQFPYPKIWIDPTSDELLRLVYATSSVEYDWLPGSKANLQHLALSIPDGYREVGAACATQDTLMPPTSANSTNCVPLIASGHAPQSLSYADGFQWGESPGGPRTGNPSACSRAAMTGSPPTGAGKSGDDFALWKLGCDVIQQALGGAVT